MTETKHLDLALELKFAAGSEETGAFTGLAAAFGNVDKLGDIIQPGAFAASIAEHKAAGTMPALCWQHDLQAPIGVIDALEETPAGLQIAGRLALLTERGREARELARMGACKALSIGYRAVKATRDARGIRTITVAQLIEISAVTIGANDRARITQMKGVTMSDDHVDDVAAGSADIEAKIAELESKAAKIDAIETELKAANKRADALELRMQRPGVQSPKDDRAAIEMKSFVHFIRSGKESLAADEVKSLQVANDTLGGYLAPADFSREVDKNLVQFSPVRSAARVGATSSGSVIVPRRTGAPTASWVGETETRSETASAYGQVEISIDELACYIDVSNKLLEDAAVNIASEVAFDLAEEFGRAEGAAFVSGTGVKQPMGFMSDTNVLSTNSGHATAITADGTIDLFYALAPAYRMRGVWMCNGTTLAAIRKLKDGDGQYLWQPGLQAGQPDMYLGRPVVEATDMPSIGAGTYPLVFGDFASAYRIYDRVSISLLRDPYSVATSGLTRFHARKRVGAGVVRSEAIRKLYISA